MSKETKTLIFIYNAESGFYNKLIDFTHKSLRPSTYPCSLCQLTYGSFSAKPEWNRFISELDLDVKFLYKDELEKVEYEFPVILLEDKKKIASVLIDSLDLKKMKTLNELMIEIKKRLILLWLN